MRLRATLRDAHGSVASHLPADSGRLAWLASLLLATCVAPLNAQEPARIRGPASSLLFTASTLPGAETSDADTTAPVVPPSHWQHGLLIGAGIGALGLGAFLYAFCKGLNEGEESCVGSGLAGMGLGAVIGGTIGALIGGQFAERKDTVASPDSTAASN